MASRFGLRTATQALRQPITRTNVQNSFRFAQRRANQTATPNATTTTTAAPEQSAFSKFLNSPVGPRTVHFWAPIMKWALALAGLADLARPASALSLSQNSALMATGLIWTRWCFVIKPRNIFLASVNFLLFCVGATQVTRIMLWQQSQKGDSLLEEGKDAVKSVAQDLEKAVEDPKSVKEAIVNPK